ncbi:signal peptidase II [Labedella endophytica]|uniref:Lipoprotein signal peptidase n=1 Tax=Labedella endophytica TaxID=1523160 RepID=A0A433JV26_9MICO|nr:signal peptidase II [Labedella endophytica]
MIAVAVSALVVDQVTKFLVVSSMSEGERIRVLGDFFVLYFVRNPGAAFSFAEGATWIFSILAAAVSVTIIVLARRIRSRLWALVFGLLLGGVLGNLTDRLFREPSFGLGHVIDFISTPWMMPAIYNIADICIVVSMGIFILLTILGVGIDGTRGRGDEGVDDSSVVSERAGDDTTGAADPDAVADPAPHTGTASGTSPRHADPDSRADRTVAD